MIRRIASLAVAGSLAAFGAIAAEDGAECFAHVDPESAVETEVCTAPVWFHTSQSPFGNFDTMAGSVATFDASEPTGTGAGFVTTSALHQTQENHHPAESAVFVGTHEGAVENLLVTMYLVPPSDIAQSSAGQQAWEWDVDALLRINGNDVSMIAGKVVPLEAAGNLYTVSFGWQNVLKRLEKFGDPAGANEYELRFHGTGIGSNASVMFFDHPDAPSGIVFNVPGELDKATYQRA